MSIQQSMGLQSLLQSDAAYAERYEELIHEVNDLGFPELSERYPRELDSWKNRKAWAKKNGVGWDGPLTSFKGFLVALGPIPKPGDTLDRISYAGPYLLANLRWASKAVQSNNKGNSVRMAVGNESLTYAEIGKRLGMSYDAVRMNIKRHGPEWAVDRLAKTSPALATEAAWDFPEAFRDEFEAMYKQRTDAKQTRLGFFIETARRAFRGYAFKASISTTNAAYYCDEANRIAELANEAISFRKKLRTPPSSTGGGPKHV